MDTLLWIAAVVAALLVGRWWGERRRRSRETFRLVARTRDLRREMKTAETALQSALQELEQLKATVAEAVVVLGPALEVLSANEAAQLAFGFQPEQRPTLMSAIRSSELREVLDGGPLGAGEAPTIHVQQRVYTVRTAQLLGQRRLLVMHDLTRMERLERARRDLVANVSHDLRTPLTAAQLLLDGLEQDLQRDGIIEEGGETVETSDVAHVAGLRRQLATIEALAQGLVDLNQLESGRALFRLAPESVATLIGEALLPIKALLEERSIVLRLEVDPSLHVLADRSHVVRALRNVTDNARRHSPRDGVIEIGASLVRAPTAPSQLHERDPDEIEIWIADQGPGIASGDQARVFERFYRGDRSRSSSGSGLGLAIAKHVVEGHGGRIWIDEAGLEGACMRMRLLSAGVHPPITATEPGPSI